MSLSFEKKSKEERAKINLERPTFMEEINWRQNLRALWLRVGDTYTNFYHGLANSHQWNNSIGAHSIDVEVTWNQEVSYPSKNTHPKKKKKIINNIMYRFTNNYIMQMALNILCWMDYDFELSMKPAGWK